MHNLNLDKHDYGLKEIVFSGKRSEQAFSISNKLLSVIPFPPCKVDLFFIRIKKVRV